MCSSTKCIMWPIPFCGVPGMKSGSYLRSEIAGSMSDMFNQFCLAILFRVLHLLDERRLPYESILLSQVECSLPALISSQNISPLLQ